MRAADLEACLQARHADGTLYADHPDHCRRVYAALAMADKRPLYRPRTEGVGSVPETACPVCDPEGWLDKGAMLACPLCHGVRLVPVKTVRWYYRVSAGDARTPRRAHRGGTFTRRTRTSTATRERVHARA